MVIKIKNMLFLSSFFLVACQTNPVSQPRLTKAQESYLDEASTPSTNELVYDQALVILGDYINSDKSLSIKVQPKPIGNTTGGAELPLNLTDMVVTALSRVSGDQFNVLPFDPNYISSDYKTGGRGTRALPNFVIEGSITEFDKDFETWKRSKEADLLVGGGRSETDIGFGREGAKRISRIVLDLHMLDYASHAVIPGVATTNSIHVVEFEKQKDFGFAIYGSGLGIRGRIKKTHGYHRAVRNLVEYSILQLLGKFYNLPYWQILGLEGIDPGITRSLRRSFKRRDMKGRVALLQTTLNQVNTNPEVKPMRIDGMLGKRTFSQIEAFVRLFAPQINLSVFSEIRGRVNLSRLSKAQSTALEDVYIAMRQHLASMKLAEIPEMKEIQQRLAMAEKQVSAGKGEREQDEEEITSPRKFFESFENSENVINNNID